jgi:nitroreductase
MEAMEALLSRRSIRKYTTDPVSDETILDILKAGMAAPTATGGAWHFIVSKDGNKLERVINFHPHAFMLRQAQAAIVVCADPTVEALPGRWPLDCAAVTENLLLAAHAIGLGAVWVGIYPVEQRINGLREIFGIPERIIPVSMVSMGYPAEQKGPSKRYDQDKIHWDQW